MVTTRILIAFCGKAGSGKDSAANAINEKYPLVTKMAFANVIKQAGMQIGISMEALYGPSELRNEVFVLGSSEADAEKRVDALHGLFAVSELCLADPKPWIALEDKLARQNYRISARDFLQTVGTDLGRARDPDIWVNSMRCVVRAVERVCPGDPMVITDVRFRNEAEFVKEIGGKLIKLVDPAEPIAKSGHASEMSVDAIPDGLFDVVIQNDKTKGHQALIDSVLSVC